jgi:hypothetical protein
VGSGKLFSLIMREELADQSDSTGLTTVVQKGASHGRNMIDKADLRLWKLARDGKAAIGL